MNSKNIINCLLHLSVVFVIMGHYSQAQQNEVSPKLDFDEAKDNNMTVVTVPGAKPGRNDGNENKREEENEEEKKGKSGPKIHGVRVTVDTGDTSKSKETKESVEITDLGKTKKRVGIHTDITFEITAEGDDSKNKTSREQDVDKEDASVPIFKGRSGGSHHKNRKPYDPKTYWNPNYSSERRSDYPSGGSYPDYYPEYYPSNVPIYIGSPDARPAGGSSIYGQMDGWHSYIPRWTTERAAYADAYNKPRDVTAYKSNAWKPCYCMVDSNEYRKRRDNTPPHYHYQGTQGMGGGGGGVARPISPVIEIIDGKLERPFSKK